MTERFADPVQCACGWQRPMFAVTTRGGRPPSEDLVIFYDCPVCGRVYSCGEVTAETTKDLDADGGVADRMRRFAGKLDKRKFD